MKKEPTGKEIAASLRRLAAFYDKHPDTPTPLIVMNAPADPATAIEFLKSVGGTQTIRRSYSNTCDVESTTFRVGVTISVPHEALFNLRSDLGVDITVGQKDGFYL